MGTLSADILKVVASFAYLLKKDDFSDRLDLNLSISASTGVFDSAHDYEYNFKY
jgi:hypothetical protein